MTKLINRNNLAKYNFLVGELDNYFDAFIKYKYIPSIYTWLKIRRSFSSHFHVLAVFFAFPSTLLLDPLLSLLACLRLSHDRAWCRTFWTRTCRLRKKYCSLSLTTSTLPCIFLVVQKSFILHALHILYILHYIYFQTTLELPTMSCDLWNGYQAHLAPCSTL